MEDTLIISARLNGKRLEKYRYITSRIKGDDVKTSDIIDIMIDNLYSFLHKSRKTVNFGATYEDTDRKNVE